MQVPYHYLYGLADGLKKHLSNYMKTVAYDTIQTNLHLRH